MPRWLLHLRKLSLARFLVNMSAGFWSVGTKCTETSPSLTFFQIKWKQMSICFVRFSWTGFEALKIAPWLSSHSGIAPFMGIPSSLKKECIHTSCLQVSDRDMYSASVKESAIVFCALLFQEIAVPLSNTRYSVMERGIGSDLSNTTISDDASSFDSSKLVYDPGSDGSNSSTKANPPCTVPSSPHLK